MTDPNARLLAYNELQDRTTSPQRLAEIASAFPEFASSIASHPNAYPALYEWALGVMASQQPPAPQEVSLTPPAPVGTGWTPEPLPEAYTADFSSTPSPASYASPYAAPLYATAAPTNTMAIVSLVMAFVFAPLAVIFGHLAHRQIAQTGEQGKGLATAGLIVGYLGCALWLVIIIFYIWIFSWALRF